MKDVLLSKMVLMVFICVCGLILVPFVHSMQIEKTNAEETTKQYTNVMNRFLRTSISDHIDQILTIIDDSPIVHVIIKNVESSAIWQKISPFLFEPADNTWFLKQHHAYKIQASNN